MAAFQFHIRRSKFKGQTTQDSRLSISVLKVTRSLTILVNKVFLKNIFGIFRWFLAEPKLSVNLP